MQKSGYQAVQCKYPLIRYFEPTRQFQPIPKLGEEVFHLPSFPNQSEAFVAAKVFLTLMGGIVPGVDETPPLTPEKRKEVEDRVIAFIHERRLERPVRAAEKKEPAKAGKV